jgi:hypothetical protein
MKKIEKELKIFQSTGEQTMSECQVNEPVELSMISSPELLVGHSISSSTGFISDEDTNEADDALSPLSSPGLSPRVVASPDLSVVKEEPDLEVSKVVSSLKPASRYIEWDQLESADYSHLGLEDLALNSPKATSPVHQSTVDHSTNGSQSDFQRALEWLGETSLTKAISSMIPIQDLTMYVRALKLEEKNKSKNHKNQK